MLNTHPDISFWQDDIPEVVNGDLEILQLTIKTLVEFALRYAGGSEQSILIRTSFDGKVDLETFLVSF